MRRNSFWNEFDFVLKDPKSPQLRRLGSGPFHLFKAEVKLGKRKPFVCVSSFTPKWHRKNTREHFQIGKTPIQQRQKFHERSGCQTSCLAQVCQRKKSQKLTSKFHNMVNHQTWGLTAERGDLTGS
jgi:hypothetical protein